jgi:serine protease Do
MVFGAGIGLGRDGAPYPRFDGVAVAQESPTTPSRRSNTTITPDLLSFADVAEQVTPVVVTVRADRKIDAEDQDGRNQQFPFGDDFFRFFHGPRGEGRQRGMGSGFIVDRNGTILTNNHVVDGADRIIVRLQDGRELTAKLVGTDPKTDIAVLRIDGGDLPSAKFGDDRKLRVGEWVLAIGSPLGPQYEHSVTAGIISAKGRAGLGLADYEDYLQTDAAINPGNSGGPLVNLRGEIVGMNSAIASRTGGYQGLSFAIPIGMVQDIMTQLVEHGKVTRAWLGVSIQDVTPDIARGLKLDSDAGILVADVVKDGPAARAGLEDGDVIVSST